MELATKLEHRYRSALESGSDSEFYKNVHAYIDHTVKNPVLSAIINKSEEEYTKRHREIWGTKPCDTDREADEKEEQSRRLEQFSLYARDYAFLHARIYQWIEEYKNHTEPDERPYPTAIVMLRGVSGIQTELWSKETLERYGKWYTNKRKEYEDRLRRFHTDFLTELEKVEVDEKEIPSEPVKQKSKVTFDTENSILKIDDKEVKITLKNDKTDGHYVLEYLFDHGIENPADYGDILKAKFLGDRKNNMSMYRACNDINRKVSEQANIGGFLDIHSGKTGWVQVNLRFW